MDVIKKEIYFGGKYYPDEKIDSEDYTQAEQKFSEYRHEFEKSLTEEQKNRLDDLVMLAYELTDCAGAERFKQGFSLGIKIGLEILEK